jgi:hypothetical protein
MLTSVDLPLPAAADQRGQLSLGDQQIQPCRARNLDALAGIDPD